MQILRRFLKVPFIRNGVIVFHPGIHIYKIEKLFKDLLNRDQTGMCSDDNDLPNPDDVTIFEDSDRFWPHGDINDQDVENYRRNLRETVKNWIINDDETSERHLKEELFRIGKYEDKNRLIALLEEMQNTDGKKIALTLLPSATVHHPGRHYHR